MLVDNFDHFFDISNPEFLICHLNPKARLGHRQWRIPIRPLKNPVNDAVDMAADLNRFGFDVMHLTNANQRGMEDAIRKFGKNLKERGDGLFYFAGHRHSMQINARNYSRVEPL